MTRTIVAAALAFVPAVHAAAQQPRDARQGFYISGGTGCGSASASVSGGGITGTPYSVRTNLFQIGVGIGYRH